MTYKKQVVNNSFKTDKNNNKSMNNINKEVNIIPQRNMSRNFSDINLPDNNSNLNINNEENINLIMHVRNNKENKDSIQITINRDKNEDINNPNAKTDDLKRKRANN